MLRLIATIVIASLALAASQAKAQVVQLPTFEMFGIGTTVNVPNGGSTVLGGINRSGASRVGGGVPGLGRLPGVGRPFGNRGTASSLSGGSARVTATVHDFEGMDRELLSQAAALRGSRPGSQLAAARQPAYRAPVLGASSAEQPALGLAELRRQRAIEQRAKQSEVYVLIDQATAAATIVATPAR